MYWLLSNDEKRLLRETMTALVTELSTITSNTQDDQLFPFVGRKDRRKANTVIRHLAGGGDLVVDPFSGSGIFAYAAESQGRSWLANEYELYTNRMSNAPWRLPAAHDIASAVAVLVAGVKPRFDYLYRTVCDCGKTHVLDSQFFDREPLSYVTVTPHERLGANGETITYRGRFSCPACGRTEKFFSSTDSAHMAELAGLALSPAMQDLFNKRLIPNSRINLSGSMTTYGNLFPHRSKLALESLWNGIDALSVSRDVRLFLQDAFFSILPQAKYKDYRSKSQDLHSPKVQLREVNLLTRFLAQVKKREAGLRGYGFTSRAVDPIAVEDYRTFLSSVEPGTVRLVLTDPPWTDGNAYFEKAQLYHPWLNYDLQSDPNRLQDEVVVTDAPSRALHDLPRWWEDIGEFFARAGNATSEMGYLALFFRPIPARHWLENLNRLKLVARRAGYEPLLAIDVSSSDPSMRIQQSASFVFNSDLIFVFVKLPEDVRRIFIRSVDMDHLAYQASTQLQERERRPFTNREWRDELRKIAIANYVAEANHPNFENEIVTLFERYAVATPEGTYLPRADTPFSGQLFDIPAIERLFTYVPIVVSELTENGATFSYDMFLLKLAEYVENGTRMLISDIQDIDIRKLIAPYAVAQVGGKTFEKSAIPSLPAGIRHIMELDPYEFESFTAELLTRQGYTQVVLMGRSGDRGVDVSALDPDGHSVVVQCKRYIGNVSAEPVQRLHSFSITRGAEKRIVITTAGFTPDAKDEARRTDTQLIDGATLEQLVATYMPNFGQDE